MANKIISSSKKKMGKRLAQTKYSKDLIHIDYLKVYYEALEFDDIVDIYIDDVYKEVIDVLKENNESCLLHNTPTQAQIEKLSIEVVDRLNKKFKD